MAFLAPLSLRPSSSRRAPRARVCAQLPKPPPRSRSRSQPPSFPACLDSLLDALRAQAARQPTRAPAASGAPKVHLVGTGPGDASLLTLRSLHHMQTADVILYDRLVSSDILQLCNPSAQLIYVGKQAGFHTRSQQDIHLLLQFFAEQKHKVVRLKGGDPFIFGRGGEEVQYLEQRGVSVGVSAGITAAAGIAAELGMALTLRDVAHSVQFVTGHAKEGRAPTLSHVDAHTTYVVYMGLQQLPLVAQHMMARGLCASTPALAVERGTSRRQRLVTAELSELARRVQQHQLQSPTLLFVGEVVRHSKVWGLSLVRGRLVETLDARALLALVQ